MITVGTWNVQNLFAPGGDGPKTPAEYETKVAGLAETIVGSGVDVLAVQEIGEPEPFEDLRSRLGAAWTGTLSTLPDVRRGIRVGVLSRLPTKRLADDAHFPSALPPLYADDTRAVVTRTGRGALTVEVTAPSGVIVQLTTCHLKSKLISYPGGRFEALNEAERGRFAAYALFQRTAEAVTVRAVADRLLAGQGRDRRLVVLGDLNDEPDAATTQILLGPSGSEFGTPGAAQPDKGDGSRLFNPYTKIPVEKRFTRVGGQRRELIDHILLSHALLPVLGVVTTVVGAPLPSTGPTPTTTTSKPFSDHAMVTAQLEV